MLPRLALIDDHESVRLGLAAACTQAGMQVSFSGVSVEEYLLWRHTDAVGQHNRPNVALLDLNLGDGSRVTDNVALLRADGVLVLVHSVADRRAAVREALLAGAVGIVSKSERIDDVLHAIRTVARGEPLNNVEWASAVEGDSEFVAAQLSIREREVLRLYAAGLPLKVVAEQLGIAFSTAKENISRARAKYIDVGRPAPTKVDLLRRAIEDGLVDAEEASHVDG